MGDPWAFGWTQILTSIGLIISIVVSILGLRTFGKWRREKVEEKRIEVALEALTIAYECQFVFEAIRNPGTLGYEYEDMPQQEGDDAAERSRRGPYYAILKRINENRPYFVKVLQLQPHVMAVFGPETEAIFRKLNEARAHVQVAAQLPFRRRNPNDEWSEQQQNLHHQCEADIWDGLGELAPQGDRVSAKLGEFREGLVKLCRPLVDRGFSKRPGWWTHLMEK